MVAPIKNLFLNRPSGARKNQGPPRYKIWQLIFLSFFYTLLTAVTFKLRKSWHLLSVLKERYIHVIKTLRSAFLLRLATK